MTNQKLKDQIEKELSRTVIIEKICKDFINFTDGYNDYYCRLTETGKYKKNSIRINPY